MNNARNANSVQFLRRSVTFSLHRPGPRGAASLAARRAGC